MKICKLIVSCAVGLAFLSIIFFGATLNATWNPPVDVSIPSQEVSGLDGPVLSVNASNNGVSVWTAEDPLSPGVFYNNIYASSYAFGSGWSAPVTISSTALDPYDDRIYTSQGDPDVVMNGSGYVVAAWEGIFLLNPISGFTVEGIFAVTRSSDGTWSDVQFVSALNTTDLDFYPQNPALAVNDSGLAVAVWNEIRNGTFYEMTNFLPSGGTWGTPVQLDNYGSYGLSEATPRVAIDPSGNAVAVWLTGSSSINFAIRAATYDAGTNLWTTVTLDPLAGFLIEFGNLPKTAISNNGNAIAVWTSRVGSVSQVRSSSFTPGVGWGASVIIAQSSDGLNEPNIVMDHLGNTTVVWDEILAGVTQVYSSTLPLGGTWSAPTLISTMGVDNHIDVGLIQKPISVDAQGNVIVIFAQQDDTLQSVARFVQGGWQQPENIFNPPNPAHTNIGYGSCGFALALWSEGLTTSHVQSADNFGVFPPPSKFEGSRCCDNTATQRRCFTLLKWAPDSNCVAFYLIRRNGVLIAKIPAGGKTSYVDPVCNKKQRFTYTLSTVTIYGAESAPVPIAIP